MKKIDKKKNKKGIIILIIIILCMISLYLIKSNYLRKYNAEKYRFLITFKEIDQFVDYTSNTSTCNEKDYCIDKKYGRVFSDIVTEKCDDSTNIYRYTKNANTKGERCKQIIPNAFPTYEGVKLSGVVEDYRNNIEANIFYIQSPLLDNKIITDVNSSFLINYLNTISNYDNNNTFQKEFKIFRKKMGIKTLKSKYNNHNYLTLKYPYGWNSWNFYKSYSPNKLYLSDPLIKIIDEYHNLKFYNTSFENLYKFDLAGTGFSHSFSREDKITVIKVNRFNYSEGPTYIVKFDSFNGTNYLVFWGKNNIIIGFDGWSEEKIEDFLSTLYRK